MRRQSDVWFITKCLENRISPVPVSKISYKCEEHGTLMNWPRSGPPHALEEGKKLEHHFSTVSFTQNHTSPRRTTGWFIKAKIIRHIWTIFFQDHWKKTRTGVYSFGNKYFMTKILVFHWTYFLRNKLIFILMGVWASTAIFLESGKSEMDMWSSYEEQSESKYMGKCH